MLRKVKGGDVSFREWLARRYCIYRTELVSGYFYMIHDCAQAYVHVPIYTLVMLI